jgi:hypothetical protein
MGEKTGMGGSKKSNEGGMEYIDFGLDGSIMYFFHLLD